MRIIDKSFSRHPKSYIIQSLLVTIAVAMILFFLETLANVAVIAVLGASTFIIFALPRSVMAQPRRLIGGHTVGIISGLTCYFIFSGGLFGELTARWAFITWLGYALAVGMSMFLMVIAGSHSR